MPDISKLPKWAQEHIELLEQNVEFWKRQTVFGPEDSDTLAYSSYDSKEGRVLGTPLGRGRRIVFGKEYRRRRFEAYLASEGRLVIESPGMALHIVPFSSNVVHVQFGEG